MDEQKLFSLGKDGLVVRVLGPNQKGDRLRCEAVRAGAYAGQRWGVGTIPIPHPRAEELREVTA